MTDKIQSLSQNNKIQILELLKSKISVAEISEKINKDESLVFDYINELRSLFEEVVEPIEGAIKESVLKKAIGQLSGLGLTKASINNKINKILKTLSDNEIKELTADSLFGLCLRQLNVGDVMINKTAGGESGVAIMTPQAAEKADNKPTSVKKPSPHVYKIY